MNVKMKNVSVFRVCLIGTATVMTATVIYGVAYYWVLAHVAANEASVTCDLLYLHQMLIQYYDQEKKWPAKLDDLKVDGTLLTDRTSGERYLYFPDARFGTGDVLVVQPEYYRLGLWPFGKVRRNVLFARRIDFKAMLQGQDAIAFRATAG